MVLSKKLCVGVRDSRYKSKSSVIQKKTHGHGYHLNFKLGDRSRVDSGLVIHWHLHLVLVSRQGLGIWCHWYY